MPAALTSAGTRRLLPVTTAQLHRAVVETFAAYQIINNHAKTTTSLLPKPPPSLHTNSINNLTAF
jgi:hypothetical protein